ncbi:putative nuclease HARBI1 [Sardina pilchardus]|uniref:putative nuclease HARBI1 n=1 Tax=Sardina pilchardus TaxID=27697 RepID=UPI002E0EF5DF
MPVLHLAVLLREWGEYDVANPKEEQCIQRFRLDREAIIYLCRLLEEQLSGRSNHPLALPVILKMTTALSVLASGSFQRVAGDALHISQASVSRCLTQFVDAMLAHTRQFVKMPETPAERRRIKLGFHRVAGFPNIVGAIDCTHISIRTPSVNENVYRDRKRWHSINVQVLCDHDTRILSICAKFPGSAHDAFILRNSSLCQIMTELADGDTWLIGDRGYPLLPWLMTPFHNPTTDSQERYNHAHAVTRSAIERTFGILKSRFRCLDDSGGCMLIHPDKACRVTVVCCMGMLRLHLPTAATSSTICDQIALFWRESAFNAAAPNKRLWCVFTHCTRTSSSSSEKCGFLVRPEFAIIAFMFHSQMCHYILELEQYLGQ